MSARKNSSRAVRISNGQQKAQGADVQLPTAEQLTKLRRRLVAWFRRHQRELPWRQSRDPYRVWLSEIMLQQTQVATVIPYFERFVASLPTPIALADAPESDVLRLWEGLGYYRRARSLHKAAQVIRDQHAGNYPRDFEQIRELPGIGRYTAGAIASIAYDTPAPILEANTVRLYSRLLAYRGDTTTKAANELLWRFAEALLPQRGAGEVNQALMELGALVCTPREPVCPQCPLNELCPTRALGLQAAIPQAKQPKRFESVREAYVIVHRRGQVLVRQRPEGERWAGLWDFPRFELAGDAQDDAPWPQLLTSLEKLTGLRVTPGEKLCTISHGVTRFRITLECYSAKFRSGRLRVSRDAPLRWVSASELSTIPLSMTARKVAQLLTKTES